MRTGTISWDRSHVAGQPIRVLIELEPGERVTGRAAIEGHEPVSFDGMLGFLTVFDRLRAAESTGEPVADSGSA